MDAIFFRDPSTQYQMENVDRELLKAYTSFRPQEQEPTSACPITTGNWGCGAFNGDRQLKGIGCFVQENKNALFLIIF
jgi:poly(ADP-ribose) glycohydrolase